MERMTILLLVGILFMSCDKASEVPSVPETREFVSSFESVDDFNNFYITPQGHLGTTYHDLSDSIVHSGEFAHRAWINGANPASITSNNNHRGYPTIQFQKTSEGVFQTPCYITLWVWLDIELNPTNSGGIDDWFSFATFTDDVSDNWDRSVLVNLSYDGLVHLQNTIDQGDQAHIFSTKNVTFPQREWVELKIYLDFRENGYAKVWQNGNLVAHAEIGNIQNKLSQAHFGMYCPPQLISGMVLNDDLLIQEVDGE
tara:strand:+ start:313945 stop:314712 length:768 start_codon:yes stop_codon:yes gene_type:complete